MCGYRPSDIEVVAAFGNMGKQEEQDFLAKAEESVSAFCQRGDFAVGNRSAIFQLKSLDARCLTGYIEHSLKIRLQSARHSETLVWKLGATLTHRRPVFGTPGRLCAGKG